MTKQINRIIEVDDIYDIFLCDIWGVLHNGVTLHHDAVSALQQLRQAGKYVVLVSNSPRTSAGVARQLQQMGLDIACYDAIVTSGDVTRHLIQQGLPLLFHIGPKRDLGLYDQLNVTLVPEDKAETIVCTGLFDDESESVESYRSLLARLKQRNLPFICANPDLVVHYGEKIVYCAGALAALYEQLGGKSLVAGKPHAPIYDAVFHKIKETMGENMNKARMVAIGDGVMTDMKGAADYGLDAIFIAGGIHREEYRKQGRIESKKLDLFFIAGGIKPVAYMMELR